MAKNYDFCGWATKNDLLCSDGRTIRRDAFRVNDGQTVPLVWNHEHNNPYNVLGHALLENRAEGVYAYCTFNDTEAGQTARELVNAGDVRALSIYANKLKQNGKDVVHGAIREVSLVIAGANPGAWIESVMAHSDEDGEAAMFSTGDELELFHSDETTEEETTEMNNDNEIIEDQELEHAEERTVQDVIDSMNEEQQKVLYALVGEALAADSDDDDEDDDEGEDEDMKHNVFENEERNDENVLSHADMEQILADAKRYGSLKDAVIAHGMEDVDVLQHGYADEFSEKYGIGNIGYLYPEAKSLNNPPDFIKRQTEWVSKVMNGVHHTPFSRIKSVFADITEDEARAKGYIKGKLKKEEVFGLLKRSTTPTTIYKKQKLDRDDIIDITDFDVVAWIKAEMRVMLNEEIARAILIGDGRLASSDDKINEQNIRPIWKDADLYTVKVPVDLSSITGENAKAKEIIRQIKKARKQYKGSGNPTFYTTEDMLTDLLLIEDENGRVIYDTVEKLRTALRVTDIVTVEVMENQSVQRDSDTYNLAGLIVNLSDYNVGADKGGAVAMFEDFDIDYNQQKYLIETRCSGALTKPFSALAIEIKA